MQQALARPESTGAAPVLYRIAVLTVTGVGVGLLAALTAIGFVAAVEWLNRMLLIAPRARVLLEADERILTAATLVVPALGGIAVGAMLTWLTAERRALGPPDIVRAVQLRSGMPGLRGGVVSTLAALVALGAGASVGQYGPMVYLGGMIGGAVERLRLGVPNLPAIAVACGVAAAISTAFNAPIAGLVFAHEVILRHYAIQAFAPVTVASVSGYVVANVLFERPALFLVDFGSVSHGWEFPVFALLGLVSAAVAVAFMRLVLACAALAPRTRLPAMLRPALAGLAVGATALALPDVLGIGKEALRFATIEGAYRPGELVLLVAAKTGLTALCIGFGFAGGVFSPALLIGSLLGALFWTGLDAVLPGASSGVVVYAVCGMMAVTSPVIGAPLTTILIVFELTRSYDLTIAAMVAVVFSNLVAYRVFGRSLFDVQLARRGVDLSAGRDRARLSAVPVTDCLTPGAPVTHADTPAAEALAGLDSGDWTQLFVTDAEGRFLGIRRGRARPADAAEAVGARLDSARLHFDETTSVWQAMEAVRGFIGDAVPVVERATGRLLGVVAEAEVITAYLAVVHDLRDEENAPA